MSLRCHLFLPKPFWHTGLISFLSMGWLCTKCIYTILHSVISDQYVCCGSFIKTYTWTYIYIYIYIYILGWSAVDQSLLGKHQQGAFRRIWKTFSTVRINQRRLLSMITWHCKSIHYPDKFLQRVVFSLKI